MSTPPDQLDTLLAQIVPAIDDFKAGKKRAIKAADDARDPERRAAQKLGAKPDPDADEAPDEDAAFADLYEKAEALIEQKPITEAVADDKVVYIDEDRKGWTGQKLELQAASRLPKRSRKADRNFKADRLPHEAQQLLKAMSRADAVAALEDQTVDTMMSHLFPGMVDLYGVRPAKSVMNQQEMFLKLTRNPVHVETIYQMVKPILKAFVTEWVQYPEHAKVYRRNSKGEKVYLTRAELEKYQKDNAKHEHKGLLRLLYLNDTPDRDGEYEWKPEFGTHRHWLDLILAYAVIANAGVTLDENRDLDPKYADAADILWKAFFVKGFEELIQTEVKRHPDFKFYMIEKQLHHNQSAHTDLYRAFVAWWALPNRGGKSRPDDVTALQSMMGFILDGFNFFDFPANLPGTKNSEKLEGYNGAHNNVPYGLAIERGDENTTNGPADVTYDIEHGGVLLNLKHDEIADAQGRTLTDRHMAALSNTYGRIYEPHQTPGMPFNYDTAETVTATKSTVPNGTALMNTGQVVRVKYGGLPKRHSFGGPAGSMMRGGTGGFYHHADPTEEHYNLRAWLRRGKHHHYGSNRCDIQAVIKDPNHKDGSKVSWVLPAYMTALLNPDVKMADIDLGTFKGGAFGAWATGA